MQYDTIEKMDAEAQALIELVQEHYGNAPFSAMEAAVDFGYGPQNRNKVFDLLVIWERHNLRPLLRSFDYFEGYVFPILKFQIIEDF